MQQFLSRLLSFGPVVAVRDGRPFHAGHDLCRITANKACLQACRPRFQPSVFAYG